MKNKEFKLSDKIFYISCKPNKQRKAASKKLYVKDVKEFIRLDDKIIDDYGKGLITEKEMWERRAKLSGLNKGEN